MGSAFQYIRDNRGLDTEKSYEYEARDGQCRFEAKNIGARDAGFTVIKEGDEEQLMKAGWPWKKIILYTLII